MKKFYFSLLICFIFYGSVSAQFRDREKVIHLGIGTNPVFFKDGFAFTAAFEYGFSKWVSGGVGLDLMAGNYTNGYVSYNYIGVCPAGRLSIHLAQIEVERLDLYFGATGGLNHFISTADEKNRPNAFKSREYFAGYFGGRFNIKKAFGVFAEVSAGVGLTNNARLGIALTFGVKE